MSDLRTKAIKLAATLRKGSPERTALLSVLATTEVVWTPEARRLKKESDAAATAWHDSYRLTGKSNAALEKAMNEADRALRAALGLSPAGEPGTGRI